MADPTPTPADWEARRPSSDEHASWRLPCPGGSLDLTIRRTPAGPLLLLRDGPGGYGPALTDPDEVDHLAHQLLAGLLAAAAVLEQNLPEKQLTLEGLGRG